MDPRPEKAIVRCRCGGDGARLRVLDVRFLKPVVLPCKIAVHIDAPSDTQQQQSTGDGGTTMYAVYISSAEGSVVHVVGTCEIAAARLRSRL